MWRFIAIIVLVICPFLVHGDPIVQCHFIFGDGLSDAGNNNNLLTVAKANYAPYGVDFSGGATGRVTNGKTNADIITQLLGFPGLIPPFRDDKRSQILNGVNYASNSGGILDVTGSHLGDRIWLDRQLLNHLATIARLQRSVQGPVSNYLKNCLYTIDIGSTDYVNNYFMPQYYPSQKLFNTEQFATLLANKYKQQLQFLYSVGARKMAVFGLGQIGCTPAARAMRNATQCVDEIDKAVDLFNENVRAMVVQLNAQLPEAKFTYIDSSAIIHYVLQAFRSDRTCCKVRTLDYQCEPLVPPCSNRNVYAFMDGYHPTEAVNKRRARIAFTTTNPNFVHPMNISRLASS